MTRKTTMAAMCLALVVCVRSGSAQQVAITTPVINVNDSFFERFGLGWNFENGNTFFNFPGLTAAPPPFGGWDPNSDARFGFGGRSGGTRFGFNLAMQQGSNRSIVGQAPTVVVPNGYGGTFFDGRVRPFVTGLVPVVGNRDRSAMFQRADLYRQARERQVSQWKDAIAKHQQEERRKALDAPTDPRAVRKNDDQDLSIGRGEKGQPVTTRVRSGGASGKSSATHGDLSVAEIKRRQAGVDAAKHGEVARLIEQARGAEQLGKTGVAKIFYRQAANRATGDLRRQLFQKIKSLK